MTASKQGELSPFTKERLFTDILLALQDRKDCYAEASELTTTVVASLLRSTPGAVVNSTDIAKASAEVLKRFDKRAFLRYQAEHPSLF